MIKLLIEEFGKINEDKKLFIFYTIIGFPTLVLAQMLPGNFLLNELLALLIIGIAVYAHICKKLKLNFFSKQILKNIFVYVNYKDNLHKQFVINYLKKYNLYTKTKILFIIDSIRINKKPKLQRDWISLILTSALALLIASINNGEVDYDIFVNIFLQYILILLLIGFIYFGMLYGIKYIYKTTFSRNSTIDLLDNILSDIYLEMK